jgi:hypothetical protein
LLFDSDKLITRINKQADLSRYCASEIYYKAGNKTVGNKNITPEFRIENAVENLRPILGHDTLAGH